LELLAELTTRLQASLSVTLSRVLPNLFYLIQRWQEMAAVHSKTLDERTRTEDSIWAATRAIFFIDKLIKSVKDRFCLEEDNLSLLRPYIMASFLDWNYRDLKFFPEDTGRRARVKAQAMKWAREEVRSLESAAGIERKREREVEPSDKVRCTALRALFLLALFISLTSTLHGARCVRP
jgi:hypothetical protein